MSIPEFVLVFALVVLVASAWSTARSAEKSLQELKAIKGVLLGGLYKRGPGNEYEYPEVSEIRQLIQFALNRPR